MNTKLVKVLNHSTAHYGADEPQSLCGSGGNFLPYQFADDAGGGGMGGLDTPSDRVSDVGFRLVRSPHGRADF